VKVIVEITFKTATASIRYRMNEIARCIKGKKMKNVNFAI